MSEGTQHVTFANMQRELEASEARHLDLARRYDALAARLADVEDELGICAEANELHMAELKAAQARLAEVEAERDGWKVETLHQQERADRLAQELEGAIGKLKAFADGVDEHWTPDLNRDKNCTCVIHRLQREAREFLARFPVREGDGDDS